MEVNETPVLILTGDLFFRAKIEAVAQALGKPVAFATTLTEAEPLYEDDGPRLVLVDLGRGPADPAAAIRALTSRPGPPRVVAFGPHRDVDAFRAARAAGADPVLARSVFVERLPRLLSGD